MELMKMKRNKKLGSMVLSGFLIITMLMGNLTFIGNTVHANDKKSNEATYTSSGNELPKFGPEKAFDGVVDRFNNKDARWASDASHATKENPKWLQVEYPEPETIEGFKVHWERANVNHYAILLSEDGDTFEKVYESKQNKGQWIETVVLDKKYQAKYAKLVIYDFDSNSAKADGTTVDWSTVSVFELEVLESMDEIVKSSDNHALNKDVEVNNYEGTTVGENAVDGDLDTHWGTEEQSDFSEGPELLIDLGHLTTIKSFIINWERKSVEQNIKAYDILYSEDNKQWFSAYGQKSKRMQQKQTINLPNEVNAKYIKLIVKDYDGGVIDWANVGVKEFEVYSEDKVIDEDEITSLDDITSIKYNSETMKLEIPEPNAGEITVVGSNAIPVIDLDGNVHEPLGNKDVKITLQLKLKDGSETTKEFLVPVEGKYKDAGENNKPEVIPALSEWHGLEGVMKVDNTTKVVVKDPKFDDAAAMLIDDLKSIGLNLSLGKEETENTIVFQNDDNNSYQKEGYGMEIEDNKISILAEQHTGAFYATRSLHQILKRSDANEINNGYIRDYPKYPVRGLMLDVGRKFTKLDYIYDFMKTMSYYKMNDFQLHLNDNFIFLEEYEDTKAALDNAYTGFRLESELEGNGHQLTSEDGYYTKDDFRDLITDSSEFGVTIVPEFDTPGHALSFVKIRPDLMYQGPLSSGRAKQERAAMLDLSNEETLPFIKSMYDEFLDGENPVIGDVPVHIGSDEYYGDSEIYRKYVDDMLKFVRDEKKRDVRVWGSLSSKSGKTPVTSENVQMQIWNVGWAEPQAMLNQGFDIINIEDAQVYMVPDAGYYYDYLNIEHLYNSYEPNKFSNGVVVDESSPQFLGGAMGLWNDQIDKFENGITSYDMFDRIFSAIPVISQKNWGSESEVSFEEFQKLSEEVGYAPGSNPRFKVESETDAILKYDFSEGKEDRSGNNYDLVKENNITMDKGLHFNGKDSYVETPLKNLGPEATLEVELTLNSADKEQVLMETDGFGKIYAVNKEGYVGYQYENNVYSFDYKLEPNKKTNLKFSTNLHKTRLFVDGKEIGLTANTMKPNNTLILPIQRIGSEEHALDGKITKLNLNTGEYKDPTEIDSKNFNVTATSEETTNGNLAKEGPIELAFDNNQNTTWHSEWSKTPPLPYEVNIELDELTKVNKMTYLPRQDAGSNGNILEYEVLVSTDGEKYSSVSKGELKDNKLRKVIDFESMEAKYVKFVADKGVGGFASAAEFTLHKQMQSDTTISAMEIKQQVEHFEEEGEITDDRTARALKTHLTAVSRYEDQERAGKVVKHMKGFKTLLDHQRENELISEDAYEVLQTSTDALIEKWQ